MAVGGTHTYKPQPDPMTDPEPGCVMHAEISVGREHRERAAADLGAALALWRGTVLADERRAAFARDAIGHLEG